MLLYIVLLQSCGGSNTSQTPVVIQDETPQPDNNPVKDEDNTQPDVTLVGEAVITLGTGQDYIDQGALAIDDEDGDLSNQITVIGTVNINVVADYLLRYRVTDSGGGSDETSRIVRVYDSEPIKQSSRRIGNTSADLSYLEHLPVDYNSDVNYAAPLIIFSHGSGATGTGNLGDVECCGLPAAILYDSWDNTLPFVILSPQRINGLDVFALDDFIEYALQNYHVDPQRVYLAGWSQGANISLGYLVNYPDKVAAVVPVAGGWFQGLPIHVCDAADVPMWSFVGSRDSSLITNTGITAAEAINSCNPADQAKLTNYVQGTHFSTSLWPFIPSETHAITELSDKLEPNLFEWLLSHRK
jgi:predicted esterase